MFSLRTLTVLLSASSLALAYPRQRFPRHNNETGLDETPGSGGSWNIIVDENDPRTVDELLADAGLNKTDLKYVWDNGAFKGFSGSFSTHCVSKMSNMTGIKHFEPEMEIKLHGVVMDATWGQQRISQKAMLGSVYSQTELTAWNYTYQFYGATESLGKGVDIYIIDTGVNVDHIDFDGRAKFGFAFDSNYTDTVGHGTHCAGTAGSSTFGVAKAANIIAVKVLSDTSGSTSDIISGIDYVITQHASRSNDSDFVGSVASMSLGSTGIASSLDEAVIKASQAGIHFSVAAGNADTNACLNTPASVNAETTTDVIAVGAINVLDQRSSFSNYGPCVDIYAPGEEIMSTYIGSNNSIKVLNGTSMAAPHVTGLLAYALAINPGINTTQMKTLLTETMALNVSLDLSSIGKNNRTVMANNGFLTPISYVN
ncbi:hypothetical protein RUND412_002743 [Rhizina undulata]